MKYLIGIVTFYVFFALDMRPMVLMIISYWHTN